MKEAGKERNVTREGCKGNLLVVVGRPVYRDTCKLFGNLVFIDHSKR